MIKLPYTDFHCVKHLFKDETPHLAVVMAVIEGNNPGHIWVNALNKVNYCLVRAAGGYSFIGHLDLPSQQQLTAILTILQQHRPVKLIQSDSLFATEIFENAGFVSINRIQFIFPPDNIRHLDKICATLPAHCQIKAIDAALLRKSNWLEYIRLFYGSEQAFLQSGFGFALLKDNEIISEAITCFTGNHRVETGSVTAETQRCNGYATIVRAFLMKEILRRGLMPISSCNEDNSASAIVLKKLGFQEDRRYRFRMLK